MDVILSALFRSTSEKAGNLLANFPKIDTVSGTKIDSAFKNTGSDTLHVEEIPEPNAIERRRDFEPGLGIQPATPFAKIAMSATVQILAHVDHRSHGSIYFTTIDGQMAGVSWAA